MDHIINTFGKKMGCAKGVDPAGIQKGTAHKRQVAAPSRTQSEHFHNTTKDHVDNAFGAKRSQQSKIVLAVKLYKRGLQICMYRLGWGYRDGMTAVNHN